MNSRRGLALLFCLVWPALSGAGVAQETLAPSQVTPPSFQPARRAPTGPVSPADFAIPESNGTPPEGAERFSIFVEDFHIDGQFEDMTTAGRSIIAPLLQKTISVATIFNAAADLERAYVRAGYAFARVTVPPQKLSKRGRIRLLVIDGFVEAVDVAALPKAVQGVVRKRTADLIGVRRLTTSQLERRLLLAGDVSGLQLRSVLARGEQTGGVRLVLDGKHRPISGGFSADNKNGVSLRRWQFGANVSINSALGFGEQIFGSLVTSPDAGRFFSNDPRLRILGAGVVIPIGVNGLTATPEYTNSHTHATPVPGGLDTRGSFERFALRLTAPLLRTRTQSISVTATTERLTQRSHATVFSRDTSLDEYSVIRGSIDASGQAFLGASYSASVTAAAGLGGRDRADANRDGVPLSRQGAGPEFSKAGFTLQYVQPLPLEGLRGTLTFAGQTTFNAPALRSEQFSLDGSNLVSGVAPGGLSVDRGLATRGEMSRAASFQTPVGAAIVAPYLFAAYGLGFLELPTALEAARLSGRSVGAGVRFDFAGPNGAPGVNVGLEIARYASYIAATRRGSRVSVSVASRF